MTQLEHGHGLQTEETNQGIVIAAVNENGKYNLNNLMEYLRVPLTSPPPSPGVINQSNVEPFDSTESSKSETLNSISRRQLWPCEQLGLRSRKATNSFSSEEARRVAESKREQKERKEDAKFEALLNSYAEGLNENGGIVSEMSGLIEKEDAKQRKKYRLLHQQWQRQVYQYIQNQLDDKLQALAKDRTTNKFESGHCNWLETTKKTLRFRDIFNKDHSPFESLDLAVTYSTKGMIDPLMHDIEKEKEEKAFVNQPLNYKPMAKEMLDPTCWSYAAFRSSIWGHVNVDEEDGSEIQVKYLEKWHSHDVMWNLKDDGKKYWNEEFPKGGIKCVPNEGRVEQPIKRERKTKGKVYGVECLTQPPLQLYYM